MTDSGRFIPEVDDADLRREKARARELRQSAWWKRRIAAGICHYFTGRGPVIVAGIAIVAEVLRRVGVDGVEASRRDLLDGAALAAAELPARAEGDAPPGAFTCC